MSATRSATPLAYDDIGNGQPVVFVHGLTFNRRTWAPITERLSDRMRCITVDLPGHRETPSPVPEIEVAADMLHRTLLLLDADPPVYVGHSMASIMGILY